MARQRTDVREIAGYEQPESLMQGSAEKLAGQPALSIERVLVGGSLSATRYRPACIGAFLMGALVFAIGTSGVVGWHLNVPVLLQLLPRWLPTQYNTALSLAALGLGIMALAFERKSLAAALAAVPVAIGVITLVTWLFRLYPGIDAVFFRQGIAISNFNPGRMSPLAAFGTLLGGLGLAFGALSGWRPRFAITAWVLGFLLGTAGTLATLLMIVHTVNPELDPARFVFLTQHGSIAFAFAGAAVALLTGPQRRAVAPTERTSELPVAAGVITATVSLLLWQSLAIAEARAVLAGNQVHWRQVASFIDNEAAVRGALYANIASRTARLAGRPEEGLWEGDSADIVRDTGWLQEIVWFDLDGTVRHRVSRAATGGVRSVTTVPMTDPQGVLRGSLAFTVELRALLEQWLGHRGTDGYNVAFREGAETIYSRPEGVSPRDDLIGSIYQDEVRVAGRLLQLMVWPGAELIERQRSQLTLSTLLFGVLLSLLLMAALHYAAVARQRTASITLARRQLEFEVEERRRAEVVARDSEDKATRALSELRQVLDQTLDLICTVNRDGYFLVVSASSSRMLGYGPEEMTGRHWSEFIYPADIDETHAEVARVRGGTAKGEFVNRAVHRSGRLVHLSWSSTWLAETGMSYAVGRDVTVRDREEALREGQRQILELIAGGSSLRAVLDAICRYVERIHPESQCSILVTDADGVRLRSAAAPSLPTSFLADVDGIEIGPQAGSCGTAAWRKRLVIVENIESDPLWDSCRSVADRYGLRSCWSTPVMGEQGVILGTFAVYSRKSATPEIHEIEMIEASAGLAAVALEREQAHQRLLEGREQLDFARRVAQLGYWESYRESDRVVLSDDMLEQLGLPPGRDCRFAELLEFVLEPDRAVLSATREAAFLHDVPVDSEIRMRLAGGAVHYVHFRGKIIRREDGQVLKLAGTVQDITSRKLIELENARLYAELENRVRSRTRELELSNRELEAFSYSVSHDLRAPLRAISGFSALLQQENGGSFSQQGQHYLERIMAGTGRMSALIDDLLELGRVSRIELHRQPLDLSALASGISGRLHERWPERTVDVEIQPDLVAWGDLKLMEVVLENLLENAWKFTGGRPVARIRIGRRQQQGVDAFFVADNGVGFDPQYAANLFGVFQRLHAASAFPGTGVGLATVQRILQRHGGRIWADARTDEGATFHFTMA